MAVIEFENVSKIYPGGSLAAVDGISLRIESGQFTVLLGPSGCGKTTLLKMVNRLQEPSGGKITLDGVEITSLPVAELRRRIGYVIQQVGLFPHMTVAKNIAVVPELLGWTREKIEARVAELLDLVQLPLDYDRRYPAQLSGGQQQRVGLARALAADPQVMLMDEPFGAIDAITRASLQDQLFELQRRLRKSILFVTHDVDEALRLADEIVILNQGKLVQKGSPCDLLNQPASDYVRQLLRTDDRVRQISLVKAGAVMQPLPDGGPPPEQPAVQSDEDLRRVLSLLLMPGVAAVTVFAGGDAVGMITVDNIRSVGCGDLP